MFLGDKMLLIPKYLESLSQVIKNNKDAVTIKIISKCGNDNFLVFKNTVQKSAKQIEKEKEIEAFGKRCGWRSYSGGILKDGKNYMYRRNIFGVIVDKVDVSDLPHNHTNIVKAKCSECNEEYVLFDNRIHGYNAFAEKLGNPNKQVSDEIEFEQKTFKGSKNSIIEIQIKIINQHSFEEFLEDVDCENATKEDYSNAFHDIAIDGIVKDLSNKKVLIISEETA